MEANAVVFEEANRISYKSVTVPDPQTDDLVIRVTHSWISNGTEGSFLRGERIAGDTPRPADGPDPFPIVPGYQKVGVVEAVGSSVRDISVGDTVFAAMGRVDGMFFPFGGHVSPSVSPRDHVWKLPAHADALAYSGMVLTQVGYNCGTRPDPTPGSVAVVIGDGLVGQWTAQTLAWKGCRTILLGKHEERLARFRGPHNRLAQNTGDRHWFAHLRDVTKGRTDIIVDTIGSIETLEALVPTMRRHGHIVSAGFYGNADRLALQPLRDSEVSVHLVSGWSSRRMCETMELIAMGHLDTTGLITHRFEARDVIEAWDCIREKRNGCLGVVLDWI